MSETRDSLAMGLYGIVNARRDTEGSWHELRQSADAILDAARAVVESDTAYLDRMLDRQAERLATVEAQLAAMKSILVQFFAENAHQTVGGTQYASERIRTLARDHGGTEAALPGVETGHSPDGATSVQPSPAPRGPREAALALITRLCALQADVVRARFGYDEPNDCFCGETGADPESFRSSGQAVDYIERVVRDSLRPDAVNIERAAAERVVRAFAWAEFNKRTPGGCKGRVDECPCLRCAAERFLAEGGAR